MIWNFIFNNQHIKNERVGSFPILKIYASYLSISHEDSKETCSPWFLKNRLISLRYFVLYETWTLITVKTTILWDMTLCILVASYQHFVETYWLHLRRRRIHGIHKHGIHIYREIMKGHGLCHEFCPLVPLPREMNAVNTLPPYCFKIQFIFILSSRLQSRRLFLTSSFLDQIFASI